MSAKGFVSPPGSDPACMEQLKKGAAGLGWIATALHETIVTGFDRDGNYLFIWMPPELEQRYGFCAADLEGKSLRDIFPPEVAEQRIAHCRQAFETGESRREEYLMQLSAGTFWHDITLAPMRDPEGRIVALVGFIRDITESKRAEHLLAENEVRYRAVVEQIADVIIIHRDGQILFANRAAVKTLGVAQPADLLGKPVLDFIHPDSRRDAAQRLARIARGDSKLAPIEARFVSPDGQVFHGQIQSQTISFDGQPAQLAVIRDVTEQRRVASEREQMQARMVYTQKLESLGLLASGVAHDFNNLLLGVLGHAGLAMADLPPNSPVRAHLEKIETAAIRASELTNQLLTYAGGEKPVLRPVKVDHLVDEMTGLLKVSMPAGVEFQSNFAPDLPPVMADSAQLRQVVMNLILNAAESIGQAGGWIRISTLLTQVSQDQPSDLPLQDRPPMGTYLALAITDSGCGLDADTCKRIFDPFFTTKATGRGLGLAAVLGIVRSHRGAIRVDSTPGEGSRFEVLLPITTG